MKEEDCEKEMALDCRGGVLGREIPLENEEEWNDSDDETLSSLCSLPQSYMNLSLRWTYT